MATMRVTTEIKGYRVVHPLDDPPEQKCSSDGLGQIAMSERTSVAQDSAWLSDLDEPDVDLSRARSRGRPYERQVLTVGGG